MNDFGGRTEDRQAGAGQLDERQLGTNLKPDVGLAAQKVGIDQCSAWPSQESLRKCSGRLLRTVQNPVASVGRIEATRSPPIEEDWIVSCRVEPV